VTVESFSIGMGPILLHKKFGATDYRISLIPFGGYCGMKGEKDFQKALDEKLRAFPKDPTSFYGVSPLRRLCIAAAGPLFNAVFAGLAFALIALVGYTYYSADNRIILADDIRGDALSAARLQGLKTGDRILSLGGERVETFQDISRMISFHPEEDLPAIIEREGKRIGLTLRPALEKSSGSGKIGVYNWIDPVIGEVPPESAAEKAGLRPGDTITAIDGEPVVSAAKIFTLLEDKTEVKVTWRRGGLSGASLEATLALTPGESPFAFVVPEHRSKKYSPLQALGHGFSEMARAAGLTLKGIALLFRGVDVSNSVSGPVRISYVIGDAVKTGFSVGLRSGLVSALNLLALISVSLFLMNLLPVPLLDGGTVLFSFIETVSRKSLPPRFLYYIQFVGLGFIALLFGFAIFSDTKYFWGVFKK
jgi:regulator of sigma E protease